MTIVLRTVDFLTLEVRVISRRYWYPVADRISTNDEATGVNTCSTYSSLEHLCVFYSVTQLRVRTTFRFLQLRCNLYRVRKVHLQILLCLRIFQSVRNSLTKGIRYVERNFLYSCHILQRLLRSHRTICNNVCTVLVSVLILNPLQHTTTTIVIEVCINIRQRNTVWIQETLKQQIILQRVYLRNAKTVSHNRACCRTTTRTHHNTEFFTCRIYEVLHNEEVTWETHRLHYVQLELYSLCHFFGQWVSIDAMSTIVCQLCKVFCLELYPIQLIIASKVSYLFLSFLFRYLVFTILVACKFFIQVFFCIFFPYLLLCSE